jgi:hypothetical protein
MKTFCITSISVSYLILGFWVIEQAETTIISNMNHNDILICAFGTCLILGSMLTLLITSWSDNKCNY